MSSGISAGTSIYTGSLAEGVQQGCTGVVCSNPELLFQLALFIGAGLLTVLVAATLSYLSRASETCERERTYIVDERDAFIAFGDRLSDISMSTATVSMDSHAGGSVLSQPRVSADTLRQVRAAYRDTVMGVSHYEDAYDESLVIHMSEEIGEDLARAVVNGQSFSPPVKDALLTAVESAVERRDLIVRAIGTELDDLDAARAHFAAIEAERESLQIDGSAGAFHLLEDRYDHSERLERDVETALVERQRRLREGVTTGNRRRDTDEFHEFVYDDIDVKYPVLAEGVALTERLRRDRDAILRRLTNIV